MKCAFCSLVDEKIIFKTRYYIFLESKYPLIKGHSLLISKRHIRTEFNLCDVELHEYIKANKRAYLYIKNHFRAPLTFINSPQQQSIHHFHKHYLPGIFGVNGVQNALKNYYKSVIIKAKVTI